MWLFPMKPRRINETLLSSLRLDDYVMERKYDGHRAILVVGKSGPKLFTRHKTDLVMTDNIRPQIESLNLPEGTVLDGELWTPTKRGSWTQNRSVVCSLSFWDVMAFQGQLVGSLPLEKRRFVLERMIGDGTEDIKVVEQEAVTRERIEKIRKEAMDHRQATQSRSGFVHGVVLKRKGSPRRDHPNRSVEHPDWMKIVYWAQN